MRGATERRAVRGAARRSACAAARGAALQVAPRAALLATLAAAVLVTACTGVPVAGQAPSGAAVSAPGSAAKPAAGAPASAVALASVATPAAVPMSTPATPTTPTTPVQIRDPAPADAAPPSAEPTLETAARAFYSYFDRIRQMQPAELAREFVRLDQPSNPGSVLELALALGQTRNPNDTVRALATLDPLLRSTDPQLAPWRPLARLLALRYNEQRRLEEQIERQNQQLRDAQRRQEQLAQQLEALKAIERSLVNRPAPASTAPAAPPAAPAVPGSNGNRPTPP